jgi:hypothetical protein
MSLIDNSVLISNTDMVDEVHGLDDNEPTFICLQHEFAPADIKKVIIGTTLTNYCERERESGKCISLFLKSTIDVDSTLLNSTKCIQLTRNKYNLNVVNAENDLYAFDFIVQYLNTFANIPEYPAIKQPIQQAELTKWLADPLDAKIFAKYININDSTTEYNIARNFELLRELESIIFLADYMGMENLLHKTCALVAYAIKNKSHEIVNKLFANTK